MSMDDRNSLTQRPLRKDMLSKIGYAGKQNIEGGSPADLNRLVEIQ